MDKTVSSEDTDGLADGAGAGADAILVSPVGRIDPDLSKAVCREVRRIFGFYVRQQPLLSSVEFALDLERRQYHSTRILEHLAKRIPPDTMKIIGIVSVDLFIPILTHVYGEAQLGGVSAVVSTFRLLEPPGPVKARADFANRIGKEAAHELGHTFKLRHCPNSTCIMHYCRSLRDVDMKSLKLCPYCRVLLEDEKKRLAKQRLRRPQRRE